MDVQAVSEGTMKAIHVLIVSCVGGGRFCTEGIMFRAVFSASNHVVQMDDGVVKVVAPTIMGSELSSVLRMKLS
eukprot:5661446-Amphidinium_carterae.1